MSLALLLVLAGCPKPEVPTFEAGNDFIYAGLSCPVGATQAGGAPPEGLHVWCRTVLPNGRWVKQGGAIEWHPSGQKSAMGKYDADRRVGEWQEWWPDGQLRRSSTWVEGRENGVVTEHHEGGAKKSEGLMVDGKPDGPWTTWSPDGVLLEQGKWVDGEREGFWIIYDRAGLPEVERLYRFGRMVSQKELAKEAPGEPEPAPPEPPPPEPPPPEPGP